MKELLMYLAIASAAIWVLILIFARPHIGFYYPYSDDLTIYEQSDGSVGSYQDCRWWAYRLHQEQSFTDYTDARFACGTKCAFDETQQLFRCKDMTGLRQIDTLN